MKIKDSLKGALLAVASGMCRGISGTLQAFMPEGASSLTIRGKTIYHGITLALARCGRQGV